MDFGIGIATSHDSWKLAQRAEELGFTHAWFFDTQMITADCFVSMAAGELFTAGFGCSSASSARTSTCCGLEVSCSAGSFCRSFVMPG